MAVLVNPGTLTVNLIRRAKTGIDAHGNDVYGTTSTPQGGCALQPSGAGNQDSSTEDLSAGDRIITRWRLFTPPGVNLAGIDAIEVSGIRYEIDGEPAPWPELNGQAHHQEIMLRRVTG